MQRISLLWVAMRTVQIAAWLTLGIAFTIGCLTACSAQESKARAAPYVAGYERFYRSPDAEFEAGRLLLQELNCTACHTADAALRLHSKQAPELSEVGLRCDPSFLRAYVSDPHAMQAGTTMPHVLGQLSPSEKFEQAEAIVHYLVSQTPVAFQRSARDDVAVQRGGDLYRNIGCVACHVPSPGEDSQLASELATQSRLFPSLDEKYSIAGLSGFLVDPVRVRASGRMPDLQLSNQQANDLANYLLRRTHVVGPLKYELFAGRRRDLNDQSDLTPWRTGLVDGFRFPDNLPSPRFTLRFRGFVEITRAGNYTFTVDAAGPVRLSVGEQTIIDLVRSRNDQPQRLQGETRLEPGWQPIALELYPPRDPGQLSLQWESSEIARSPIPLESLRSSLQPATYTTVWQLNSERVQQGRLAFVQGGCANCHAVNTDPELKALVGTIAANRRQVHRPLRELDPSRGCLSGGAGSYPNYTLDAQQRAALQRVITSLQAEELPIHDAPSSAAEQLVQRRMTSLNCYACHERNGIGGVRENRNQFFTCNEPDLGDEGRLPPRLTGVGDKLRPEWLQEVVNRGASVRPYMDTRMPRFGEANLSGLVDALVSMDRQPHPLPDIRADQQQLREVGRQLVGAGKLQCISCHKFNRHNSSGIQAMDLVDTTQRLNHDWFHRYMLNPAALRPGTRMPVAWPGGESFFPDILNGSTAEQIEAIWSYLSDGEQAINPEGLVPRNMELVVAGNAVVYRNKLWEAGWRGIAVGFPQHVNLAFDAEEKRLALLWKGRFLNVTPHWSSQSMGRLRPAGNDVIVMPHGPTLAHLRGTSAVWPTEVARDLKFRGYTLDKQQRPTFLLQLGNVDIEDFSEIVQADEQRAAVRRSLRFSSPATVDDLWFLAWRGESVTRAEESGWFTCDGELDVRVDASVASRAVIAEGADGVELRLPIELTERGGELMLEYRW